MFQVQNPKLTINIVSILKLNDSYHDFEGKDQNVILIHSNSIGMITNDPIDQTYVIIRFNTSYGEYIRKPLLTKDHELGKKHGQSVMYG